MDIREIEERLMTSIARKETIKIDVRGHDDLTVIPKELTRHPITGELTLTCFVISVRRIGDVGGRDWQIRANDIRKFL